MFNWLFPIKKWWVCDCSVDDDRYITGNLVEARLKPCVSRYNQSTVSGPLNDEEVKFMLDVRKKLIERRI